MIAKFFFTLVVIVCFLFFIKKSRVIQRTILQQDEGEIPNAYSAKSSALTIKEQQLFVLLKQYLANKGAYNVFPKPQLSTFITLDPALDERIKKTLASQLKQLECDFIIVDPQFNPIIALSFNIDSRLISCLNNLKIPYIPLDKNKTYNEKQVNHLLSYYLHQ